MVFLTCLLATTCYARPMHRKPKQDMVPHEISDHTHDSTSHFRKIDDVDDTKIWDFLERHQTPDMSTRRTLDETDTVTDEHKALRNADVWCFLAYLSGTNIPCTS